MIYADIVDVALSYSDRQDDEVVSRIPLFIKLVESRVNKKLDTQLMNTRVVLPSVADSHLYDLPENWLHLRDINVLNNVTGMRTTLSMISPEQMNNAITNVSDQLYYTIMNNQIYINPTLTIDQSLELNYANRLQGIDAVTTTENWLAKYHPDCYIYGILVEINSFVKDADAANVWDLRFKESIEDLTFQDDVATYSGVALQTRAG